MIDVQILLAVYWQVGGEADELEVLERLDGGMVAWWLMNLLNVQYGYGEVGDVQLLVGF